MNEVRVCYTCKEEKPLIREFWYMRKGKFKRQCKLCEKTYMAEWKEKNPDYKEAWYEENKETIKERVVQWQKDNPDKVTATRDRREERKRTNGAYDDDIKLSDLIERDEGICWLCEGPVDIAFKYPAPTAPSIDHVKRLAHGGTHTWDNVKLAHARCNMKRPKG